MKFGHRTVPICTQSLLEAPLSGSGDSRAHTFTKTPVCQAPCRPREILAAFFFSGFSCIKMICHVAAHGNISFFLWLSNIPLYACTTRSLSIHLLMDSQVCCDIDGPEIVILGEVTQTEKDRYYMISLICGVKKKILQMNLFTKQKQIHRPRKQTYTYQKGKRREINQEFGIKRQTLLYTKQINNSSDCIAWGTIFSIL